MKLHPEPNPALLAISLRSNRSCCVTVNFTPENGGWSMSGTFLRERPCWNFPIMDWYLHEACSGSARGSAFACWQNQTTGKCYGVRTNVTTANQESPPVPRMLFVVILIMLKCVMDLGCWHPTSCFKYFNLEVMNSGTLYDQISPNGGARVLQWHTPKVGSIHKKYNNKKKKKKKKKHTIPTGCLCTFGAWPPNKECVLPIVYLSFKKKNFLIC